MWISELFNRKNIVGLQNHVFINSFFELGIAPLIDILPEYYLYDNDGWYIGINNEDPEHTSNFTEIKPPQFEPGKTRPKFDISTGQWSVLPYKI